MRTRTWRAVAIAAAAAIALTSFEAAPAMAGPAQPSKRTELASHVEGLEVSARRRHRHSRGNAAMLGAVTTMFGTIAALAAADAYRKRYYAPYAYDGYYAAPYPSPYWRHRYRYWHRRW